MADSFGDIDDLMFAALRDASKEASNDVKDVAAELKAANEKHDALADVVASIRSRVEAGDAGTSVAGTVAPGWGGSALGPILGSIGLIVVAGAVGGVLGATHLLAPSPAPAADLSGYVATASEATTYICPGGPASGVLDSGTRVLAVSRDAGGSFLGVRDPYDYDGTLWLAVADLRLDAGGIDPSGLPVGECPEVPVTDVTPEPEPTEEPEPDPTQTTNPQPPPPPADTTAPVGSQMSANPTGVINGQSSVISFVATDNVAVTGATLSWAGPNGITGSAPMTLSSGQWRYTWSYASLQNGFGNWTFTARASDAAGNLSAPVQVVVYRQYLG